MQDYIIEHCFCIYKCFWGVYRNPHVLRQAVLSVHLSCPSVCLVRLSVSYACKRNSYLTDEPILMKLYTVTVYNLIICIKEDNHGPKYFKGDDIFGLCAKENQILPTVNSPV